MAILIYGANGYTGKLITKLAHSKNMRPILGGRNAKAIQNLAETYGFAYRIFPCEHSEEIRKILSDSEIQVVLHCAGPFSQTAKVMMRACRLARVHYLDITGEIGVFEALISQYSKFERDHITAISGVGFDIIPSDCLALKLKNRLPDATQLELILSSSGNYSPGTMKTMAEGFYVGSVIRKEGKIRMMKQFVGRNLQWKDKKIYGISIPWGDVSTAFYTTKIPNIAVYMRSNEKQLRFLNMLCKGQMVFKIKPVQKLLKLLIGQIQKGPSQQSLISDKYKIYGIARNDKGEQVEFGIVTPNGYTFTAHSSLLAAEELLKKQYPFGAFTPAALFGEDFALKVPGVRWLGH